MPSNSSLPSGSLQQPKTFRRRRSPVLIAIFSVFVVLLVGGTAGYLLYDKYVGGSASGGSSSAARKSGSHPAALSRSGSLAKGINGGPAARNAVVTAAAKKGLVLGMKPGSVAILVASFVAIVALAIVLAVVFGSPGTQPFTVTVQDISSTPRTDPPAPSSIGGTVAGAIVGTFCLVVVLGVIYHHFAREKVDKFFAERSHPAEKLQILKAIVDNKVKEARGAIRGAPERVMGEDGNAPLFALELEDTGRYQSGEDVRTWLGNNVIRAQPGDAGAPGHVTDEIIIADNMDDQNLSQKLRHNFRDEVKANIFLMYHFCTIVDLYLRDESHKEGIRYHRCRVGDLDAVHYDMLQRVFDLAQDILRAYDSGYQPVDFKTIARHKNLNLPQPPRIRYERQKQDLDLGRGLPPPPPPFPPPPRGAHHHPSSGGNPPSLPPFPLDKSHRRRRKLGGGAPPGDGGMPPPGDGGMPPPGDGGIPLPPPGDGGA